MTDAPAGARPSDSRASSTSVRRANRAVLGFIAALIGVSILLGTALDARAAVVTIALGCLVYAAARASLPVTIVPAARTRWFDATILVLAALVLLVLLPVAGPGMDRPIPLP